MSLLCLLPVSTRQEGHHILGICELQTLQLHTNTKTVILIGQHDWNTIVKLTSL